MWGLSKELGPSAVARFLQHELAPGLASLLPARPQQGPQQGPQLLPLPPHSSPNPDGTFGEQGLLLRLKMPSMVSQELIGAGTSLPLLAGAAVVRVLGFAK